MFFGGSIGITTQYQQYQLWLWDGVQWEEAPKTAFWPHSRLSAAGRTALRRRLNRGRAPHPWDHPWDLDTRTDIYGLGVLLYELLPGSTLI